jgi:hypothetical protein
VCVQCEQADLDCRWNAEPESSTYKAPESVHAVPPHSRETYFWLTNGHQLDLILREEREQTSILRRIEKDTKEGLDAMLGSLRAMGGVHPELSRRATPLFIESPEGSPLPPPPPSLFPHEDGW